MKGSFSEEALAAYQQALAERDGMDYSESDSYDFARCVRSDGSFYGTRGKCKKGKDAGEKGPDEHTKKERERLSPELEAFRKERDAMTAKIRGDAKKEGDAKRAAAGAPARKPRASASELKASQEKLFDDAKAKRAAAREAEKAAKQVAKETKGDKSPEARKKRLEAGRAWDKAATAADSAQRKWMKEHERWSKASGREKRAKMSPEQRKEQRNIDRIIRERG